MTFEEIENEITNCSNQLVSIDQQLSDINSGKVSAVVGAADYLKNQKANLESRIAIAKKTTPTTATVQQVKIDPSVKIGLVALFAVVIFAACKS